MHNRRETTKNVLGYRTISIFHKLHLFAKSHEMNLFLATIGPRGTWFSTGTNFYLKLVKKKYIEESKIMQDLSNDVGSLVKSASWIMKSPSKKTSTILFRSFCLMIIVMCIECKATCGLLRCALPGSLWRILRKGSLRRTCSPSFRWHHHQFFLVILDDENTV